MICPDCGSPLCEYSEADIKCRICWNCGYYESDSQAYREHPEFFANMVKANPSYFTQRFLLKSSAGILQRKKSDNSFAEPLKRYVMLELRRNSRLIECR